MVPQRRPTKRKIGAQNLPLPVKRPKKTRCVTLIMAHDEVQNLQS